ncbi:MAG: peptidoglycan-binding domain-containing protein [Patescibacteria group bacterium]
MRIKYFLITAVLATSILGSGGFVKAQTTDNSALIAQLQAQIQAILQQIAQLQAQQDTNAVQNSASENANSDSSKANWCYNFKQNLWIGKNGRPVEALQIALSKEGLFDASLIKNPWRFGPSTLLAVIKFQNKYSIKPTGYVGFATNKKLNELYGCKTTESSVTVTSPNGGEEWVRGSTHNVTWTSQNVERDVYLTIKNFDTNVIKSISLAPVSPVSDSASFNIPSDLAVGNKYKVRVGNSDVSDYSDNYFSILDTTTSSNASITVTSPNGGETWQVGGTHNITWFSQGANAINYNVQIGIIDNRYSTESGDRSEKIIVNSIPNTGSYSWTVPQSIGTMNLNDTIQPVYKIVVHSRSDAVTGVALGDSSDNPFSIVAPTVACTSFTYSAWGACQSNNTQTRTVVSSSPTGCAGGSPILSQSCGVVKTVFSNSQIYLDANSKVAPLSCTNYKCNGSFGYCSASCGGGYYPDNLTAQKLCQKKGYDAASSFTIKNGFYASCSDNYMWKWNGVSAEYVWSCVKNSGIDTVTCSKTVGTTASIDSQDQLASISSAIQRIAQQIQALFER